MKNGVFLKKNHELSDLIDEFRRDKQEEEEKTTKPLFLGFKQGEGHAVIPSIRKLPLPREDGYRDTFQESRHASERPYGKEFWDEVLERKILLEQDPNYRLIVVIAGAMNESPYEQYEEEDVERQLRVREQEKIRMHKEANRTLVDIEGKQAQQKILKKLRKNIQHDQNTFRDNEYFGDLVNVGRFLVDGSLVSGVKNSELYGIIPIMNTALDMSILIGSMVNRADQQTAMERIKAVVEDHVIGDEVVSRMSDAQKTSAFMAITIFKHFLDSMERVNVYNIVRFNKSYLSNAEEHIMDIYAVMLSLMHPEIDASGGEESDTDDDDDVMEVKKEEEKKDIRFINIDPLDTGESGEDYKTVDGVDWLHMRGTETVVLYRLEEFYSSASIKEMVKFGLHSAYANHPNTYTNQGYSYETMIYEYLYPTNNELLMEHMRYRLNVFSSGKNGQPAAVMKVLHTALKEYDATIVRKLLISHFAWQYFQNRSVPDLATDWNNNAMKDLLSTTSSLNESIDSLNALVLESKPVLSLYFGIMMRLCNVDKVPSVIGTTSIFKFPRNIVIFDYEKDKSPERFDEMNRLFMGYNVLDFIVNYNFKEYYTTGNTIFRIYDPGSSNGDERRKKKVKRVYDNDTPINQVSAKSVESYGVQRYPLIGMHYIFESYYKFIEYYQRTLTQQLSEVTEAIIIVNEKMIDIARERENVDRMRGGENPHYSQKKSFTSQPINCGILTLKAKVIAGMENAYQCIQTYCPSLRDLPMEEFQSDKAYACGLTISYANLVAALIAEVGLSHQKTYKSLASQRIIETRCVNVFNRFKSRFKTYGFRKRPGGHYEVYANYSNKAPVTGGNWRNGQGQLFSGLNISIW